MLKTPFSKIPACVVASLMLLSLAIQAQTSTSSPAASAAEQLASSPAVSNQPVVEPAADQTKQSVTSASPVAPVEPKTNSNITAASKPGTAGQLANLIGGLGLILVLIFGLSWFVKRFSQGGFMQNPAIKMVASMPLGTRERLMLVEVGGKQLLLGVTATQISNLHTFDHPVVTAGDKEPGSDFSQKLMAILQQKNISQSGGSSPRDHQA